MQVSETWFESFFSGMFNEMWRMLRTERNTVPEADFIERALQHPGARILDVPCGAGRLGVELAARGHDVVGVDLCEEFLDEARAASASRQLSIAWHLQDMRELPWTEHFDAAICFGTSFGFLDEGGDFAFTTAVHRALKTGGLFIIDTTKLLEIVLGASKPKSWARLKDIVVTYEHYYDLETALERTDYDFFRNGTHEQKSCQQRLYTYRELCGLLQRAGFVQCHGYSSLDQKPLKAGLQRALLVAKKGDGPSLAS